jgi:uncharacterized protein YfaS (alpha-2-macroglobulin family)
MKHVNYFSRKMKLPMTDMTMNEEIPKQLSYRERNRQVNNSEHQIIDIMRNDMVLSKYPSGEINTARLWYTKSL